MACTVKVSNVSSKATIKDIEEFFSYSGQIDSINLNSDGEDSQIAYVTFKDRDSLKIALLLSGFGILDKDVTISAVSKSATEELALEAAADLHEAGGSSPIQSRPGAVNRAHEIVKLMLSRGLFVRKDAMRRAQSMDEKRKNAVNADGSSNQKNKMRNVDDDVRGNHKNPELKSSRNGDSNMCSRNEDKDRIVTHNEEGPQVLIGSQQSQGGSRNMRENMQKCYQHVCAMNEKLQIGQRTMSALASAQQGVASAGSAVASNKFIAAGGVWVSGALARVSLKSSTGPHDGEGASPHHEHVQLAEMTSLASHKNEHD